MYAKTSIPFQGFLQASGLVLYISLIDLFFIHAETILGDAGEALAPIIMLLLFVISAVTCAAVVLGRVGYLFWEKRYKESFTLLGWTLGWSVGYLLLVMGYLYFV